MSLFIKFFIWSFLAVINASVLVGCNSDHSAATSKENTNNNPAIREIVSHSMDQTLPDPATLSRKENLIISYPMNPMWLNPLFSFDFYTNAIQRELFLPLLRYELMPEPHWQPVAAERLEWSEDQTQLTMYLRQDLLWSDGHPLTANDVKYAYDTMTQPGFPNSLEQNVRINMLSEWNPKVTDDFTLVWKFKNAYDPYQMLNDVSKSPAPKHILEKYNATEMLSESVAQQMVYSGAWIVAERKPNEYLKLTPNPHAPAEITPRLNSVTFKVNLDPAAHSLTLESNAVDMRMNTATVPELNRWMLERPDLKVYRWANIHAGYFNYNLLDPQAIQAARAALRAGESIDWKSIAPHALFGDARVRRALAKAINVDELIAAQSQLQSGERFAVPYQAFTRPDLKALLPDVVPFAFNPELAKKELQALGWEDHDGDEILDKEGKVFQFVALCPTNFPAVVKDLTIMQQRWRAIGVDMQLENVETGTLIDRNNRGDFDAFLLGFFTGADHDYSFYWQSSRDLFNGTGYSNPEVDRLIELWHGEGNEEKANQLLQQIQSIYYQDQPLLFIRYSDMLPVIQQRVHGVDMRNADSPLYKMYQWWVMPEDVRRS